MTRHIFIFCIAALLGAAGCASPTDPTPSRIQTSGNAAPASGGSLHMTVEQLSQVVISDVTVSGMNVTIAWLPVTKAASYEVVMTGPNVGTVTTTSTSLNLQNLDLGAYTVKVRALASPASAGILMDGDYSAEQNFSITVHQILYTFNGWRPPVSLNKTSKSGSTLPVKFLVTDDQHNPVTSNLDVTVTIGAAPGVKAVLDDASIGQWKAEVVLMGKGAETLTLTGNITPASKIVNVR